MCVTYREYTYRLCQIWCLLTHNQDIYIEINVSDDVEAKKILKSWGIIIGANGEIQDEEDSKDEL